MLSVINLGCMRCRCVMGENILSLSPLCLGMYESSSAISHKIEL